MLDSSASRAPKIDSDALLEGLPWPLLSVRQSGERLLVVYHNLAAWRQFGARPTTLIGLELAELMAASPDVDAQLARIAEVIHSGEPANMILDLNAPQGRCEWVVTPLPEDGHLCLIMQGGFCEQPGALGRDPVTGLFDLGGLSDNVVHLGAHADGGLTVLVELARFGELSKTFGQAAGERLLREIARRLDAADNVTRVMRDTERRFVICLKVFEHRSEEDSVQGLLAALQAPYEFDCKHRRVSFYVGWTRATDDTQHYDNARIALDVSRHALSASVVRYEPSMREALQRRLDIEEALRLALDREQLSLHYQPQVDVRSGMVVGFEALLRWTDPVLGSVSPGEFIPIAEDCGLICDLGAWVLKTAVRQIAAWEQAGVGVRVSVNVSPQQLVQGELRSQIAAALGPHTIQPAHLCLELTEQALLQVTPDTRQALLDARARGLSISIDDFGKGYSNLHYLMSLPAQCLKLDLEFIRGIGRSRQHDTIVTSVIDLAHKLGLYVVAEGVETVAQLAFLRDRKCDFVQGFLVGKPMHERDASAVLRHRQPLIEPLSQDR